MREAADRALLRRLPEIRRARGFHLYSEHGTRYLDLYQNGGRAVLGHRPNAVATEIKRALSQGLYAELPSVYEARLKKAVRTLVPTHPRVVLGGCAAETERAATWRPFMPPAEGGPDDTAGRGTRSSEQRPEPEIVRPVLPFPSEIAPALLCYRDGSPRSEGAQGVGEDTDRPLLSPLLLAGVTRAVHDLIKWGTAPEAHFVPLSRRPGKRGAPRDGLRWEELEHTLWKKAGPYLWPNIAAEHYEALFEHFLSRRILISPSPVVPTILPRSWSRGECDAFLAASDAALEDINKGSAKHV